MDYNCEICGGIEGKSHAESVSVMAGLVPVEMNGKSINCLVDVEITEIHHKICPRCWKQIHDKVISKLKDLIRQNYPESIRIDQKENCNDS